MRNEYWVSRLIWHVTKERFYTIKWENKWSLIRTGIHNYLWVPKLIWFFGENFFLSFTSATQNEFVDTKSNCYFSIELYLFWYACKWRFKQEKKGNGKVYHAKNIRYIQFNICTSLRYFSYWIFSFSLPTKTEFLIMNFS